MPTAGLAAEVWYAMTSRRDVSVSEDQELTVSASGTVGRPSSRASSPVVTAEQALGDVLVERDDEAGGALVEPGAEQRGAVLARAVSRW